MKFVALIFLAIAAAIAFALPARAVPSTDDDQAGIAFLFDGQGLKFGLQKDIFQAYTFSKNATLWLQSVIAKDSEFGDPLWTGGGVALRFVTNTGLTVSIGFGGTANLIRHSLANAPALWYGEFALSWPLKL